MTFQRNTNLHLFMLKGFLTIAEVSIFFPENSTIASGKVNMILLITASAFPWLTPDVISFFSALNIPCKSEQKQKFQITKSPPVLHGKWRYSLTLDNFSLSSQQLVPNYILYPCIFPDIHLQGIWPNFDQINISPNRQPFSSWVVNSLT